MDSTITTMCVNNWIDNIKYQAHKRESVITWRVKLGNFGHEHHSQKNVNHTDMQKNANTI